MTTKYLSLLLIVFINSINCFTVLDEELNSAIKNLHPESIVITTESPIIKDEFYDSNLASYDSNILTELPETGIKVDSVTDEIPITTTISPTIILSINRKQYHQPRTCDPITEIKSECVQCSSCEDPEPKSCGTYCYPGCQCAPGYLRDFIYCIKQSDCPSCPVNEHFRECGTHCEPTCDNFEYFPYTYCDHSYSKTIYSGQCNRGCFCNYGFVRDLNKNGTCVPIKDCPKKCGPNEYWDVNGEPCIRSSEDTHPKCLFDERKPSCVCNTGFKRDKITNKCVSNSLNVIETSCRQNETYSLCGSDCALQCHSNLSRKKCRTICERGCFCKDGYFRDSYTGNCVLKKDCKQPHKHTWMESPTPVEEEP